MLKSEQDLPLLLCLDRLYRQKSYDRMELREVRGRLLSSDSAPSNSATNYGAVNPGFTKEDAVSNLVRILN